MRCFGRFGTIYTIQKMWKTPIEYSFSMKDIDFRKDDKFILLILNK